MAALFVVTFSASNPLAAYGVFLPILAEEFGWSRGAISVALTINFALGGFSGFVFGALADRRGPRALLVLTCVLAGAGFGLVALVNTLWQLYVVAGVMAGIGMSAFYILATATAARWFQAQRGLAIAIVLTGYSLGVMTGGPLAAFLIGAVGWRIAYALLGALVIVVGGAASLVVTFPAENIGGARRPPDRPPHSHTARETRAAAREPDRVGSARETSPLQWPGAPSGFTLREAMHDTRFWLFAVSWMFQGAVLMMISVHIVSYARDRGLTLERAALALTAYGLGSVIGRMGFGAAADRRGTMATVYVCYAIQIAALGFLLLVDSPWVLLGLVAAFGAGIIGADAVVAKAMADVFGLRAFGAIIGVLGLTWRVGAALGPAVAGFVRDATGSYVLAFGAAPVVVLMSLGLYTRAVRRDAVRSTRTDPESSHGGVA